MVLARCVFAGYLIAAVMAISLSGTVGSLGAILIFCPGGGVLAFLLALAWHLLVPKAEPQEKIVSECWSGLGRELLSREQEDAA